MKVTLFRKNGAEMAQRLVSLDVLVNRMMCDRKNNNKKGEVINFAVALGKGEGEQELCEYNGLVWLHVPN